MKLLVSFVFLFSTAVLSSLTESTSSYFNVLDYGANGNGKKDDSEAFLKAWNDACASTEDNPTLRVPFGKTFLLNPLKFQGPCKSERINFDLGGIVMAPSKDEWSNDGVDKWIQFYDIDSLTVKGDGRFDGQGSSWWDKDCHKHCKRPTALFFHNCNGLHLNKTKHVNSGRNHMSINNCNDVIISDIHITAPDESPNTDGIDISGSKNVRIQDSFIGTGDDCVAINDGSSNIDIIGLTCGPGHGISIGSLGKDGDYNVVENVYVSDCILQDTQNGVRIKTWEGGYGYAKNITFEKITLENVKNPIIIDQHYTAYAYRRKNKGREIKVSDVTYRDVHGTSANEKAITLDCSRARCTNIIMEEVNITTSSSNEEAKSFCQNADGKSTSTVPPVPCLSKSH
ncbi:probable polygalacturonase At3g15720 [Cucurbita maxima]|uniref:endo-polygalacturonase n=1 Tax=Cucurbita maxima TaxID=3661 RepID=A0A6J1IWN4_CUCMA|nr:probable polygalacturonase At3g15720 [Cucurbita maxima]